MIELTDAMVVDWFGRFLWPFFRILGLMMTAPLLGTRSVPARFRVIAGATLAAVIGPLAPPVDPIDPLTIPGGLVAVHQVIIGAALGLAVRLVFLTFEISGQLIAQQMGLGFASMVDPQTGAQVPVVAQFYVTMATLLFLVLDGHLMLVKTLAESFEVLPVGAGMLPAEGLWAFFDWMGYLIAEALRLALPVITALLIVNVGFGVMSRAAPQLNIFVVGFPVMMVAGLATMLMTFGRFPESFERLMTEAFTFIDALFALT